MLKKNTYTPKRSKTIDSPQPTPKHKTQTNPPISTTQPTSTTTQKPATKKWANKPRILRSPKFPVLTKFAKFRYTKRFIAFIMAFMVLATSVALDAFAFGADVIVAINNPVPAFTVDEGGAFPTHNTTHATVSHTGTGAGSLQAAITAVGSPTVAQPGGSFDNPFIIGITADLHLTATQASTAGITASQQNRGRYIRFVPMNGNRQITVSGNFRHFSFSGTTHLQISGNNQTTGTTGQHTLTLMGRGNQPGGGVLVNTQGIPTGVVGNQTATPASFRLMPGGRITNVQQSGNGGAVLVQGHSQFIMDGGIISNNQAVMGGAVRADTGGVFIMNAGIIENNRATQDTGWWHTPNNPNGGGGVSINGAAIQQNTNNHANWSARRSSFTMNNGTIQNNHSTRGSGGGVGVQARGLFTMNGGNILNNQASDVRDNGHQRDGSGGGGVDVNGGFILQGQIQVSDPAVGFRAGNARFIMNGGNIDGNRAMYGGAVRVSQSAYFEFNNGQLSNNNATVSSGAVHIRENSLMNMNGGEIFGNIARGAGGWLIDIRSNNNYGYGGGVHLYSWNATFNMNGGTIHNNTAGIGGGIGALNSFLNIGTGWNTHGSPSIPGVATGAGLSGRPFTNAQIIPNRADTTNTTVPLNGTPRIHSNLSTNASDDLHNNNVNRTGGYAPLTYGGGGGGGVYYYAFAWDFGQRFVLGNAIIENNRSQLRGGGVFLVEGAMFMQDGARIRNNHTIRQHNVNNAGGGIAIMNHVAGTRTRFIMNGGEIYDNTARNGGGLARVAAQGFQSTMNRSVIHLHNGTIRNNTAVYFGGGVFTENFSRASGMPGITLAPTQSAVRNNRDNLFVSPQMVFAGNEAHEFSLALANFQVQQHANVGNVNSGTNMNNTATLRPNVQWQGNNSIPSVWSDLETFTALFAHLGLPLTDPVPLGWTGWSLFNNHDIDNGVGRHVPIFDPPEDGRVAIAITPDDNGTLDDGGVYINLQPDGGWEDPIVEISEDANGNPEEVVITLIPRPGTSVDDENIYVLLPPEWTYVTERDENGNIIITATPPPNRFIPVIFDLNGGDIEFLVDTNQPPLDHIPNRSVLLTELIVEPVNSAAGSDEIPTHPAGHLFLGWRYQSELGQLWDFETFGTETFLGLDEDGQFYVPDDYEILLVAAWELNNDGNYTIDVRLNEYGEPIVNVFTPPGGNANAQIPQDGGNITVTLTPPTAGETIDEDNVNVNLPPVTPGSPPWEWDFVRDENGDIIRNPDGTVNVNIYPPGTRPRPPNEGQLEIEVDHETGEVSVFPPSWIEIVTPPITDSNTGNTTTVVRPENPNDTITEDDVILIDPPRGWEVEVNDIGGGNFEVVTKPPAEPYLPIVIDVDQNGNVTYPQVPPWVGDYEDETRPNGEIVISVTPTNPDFGVGDYEDDVVVNLPDENWTWDFERHPNGEIIRNEDGTVNIIVTPPPREPIEIGVDNNGIPTLPPILPPWVDEAFPPTVDTDGNFVIVVTPDTDNRPGFIVDESDFDFSGLPPDWNHSFRVDEDGNGILTLIPPPREPIIIEEDEHGRPVLPPLEEMPIWTNPANPPTITPDGEGNWILEIEKNPNRPDLELDGSYIEEPDGWEKGEFVPNENGNGGHFVLTPPTPPLVIDVENGTPTLPPTLPPWLESATPPQIGGNGNYEIILTPNPNRPGFEIDEDNINVLLPPGGDWDWTFVPDTSGNNNGGGTIIITPPRDNLYIDVDDNGDITITDSNGNPITDDNGNPLLPPWIDNVEVDNNGNLVITPSPGFVIDPDDVVISTPPPWTGDNTEWGVVKPPALDGNGNFVVDLTPPPRPPFIIEEDGNGGLNIPLPGGNSGEQPGWVGDVNQTPGQGGTTIITVTPPSDRPNMELNVDDFPTGDNWTVEEDGNGGIIITYTPPPRYPLEIGVDSNGRPTFPSEENAPDWWDGIEDWDIDPDTGTITITVDSDRPGFIVREDDISINLPPQYYKIIENENGTVTVIINPPPRPPFPVEIDDNGTVSVPPNNVPDWVDDFTITEQENGVTTIVVTPSDPDLILGRDDVHEILPPGFPPDNITVVQPGGPGTDLIITVNPEPRPPLTVDRDGNGNLINPPTTPPWVDEVDINAGTDSNGNYLVTVRPVRPGFIIEEDDLDFPGTPGVDWGIVENSRDPDTGEVTVWVRPQERPTLDVGVDVNGNPTFPNGTPDWAEITTPNPNEPNVIVVSPNIPGFIITPGDINPLNPEYTTVVDNGDGTFTVITTQPPRYPLEVEVDDNGTVSLPQAPNLPPWVDTAVVNPPNDNGSTTVVVRPVDPNLDLQDDDILQLLPDGFPPNNITIIQRPDGEILITINPEPRPPLEITVDDNGDVNFDVIPPWAGGQNPPTTPNEDGTITITVTPERPGFIIDEDDIDINLPPYWTWEIDENSRQPDGSVDIIITPDNREPMEIIVDGNGTVSLPPPSQWPDWVDGAEVLPPNTEGNIQVIITPDRPGANFDRDDIIIPGLPDGNWRYDGQDEDGNLIITIFPEPRPPLEITVDDNGNVNFPNHPANNPANPPTWWDEVENISVDENGRITVIVDSDRAGFIVGERDVLPTAPPGWRVETTENTDGTTTVTFTPPTREIVIDVGRDRDVQLTTAPDGTQIRVGNGQGGSGTIIIELTPAPGQTIDPDDVTVNVPRGWDYQLAADGESVFVTPPTVVVGEDRIPQINIPGNGLNVGDIADRGSYIQVTFTPDPGRPFDPDDFGQDIAVDVPPGWGWWFARDGEDLILIIVPPETAANDSIRPPDIDPIWAGTDRITGMRVAGATVTVVLPSGAIAFVGESGVATFDGLDNFSFEGFPFVPILPELPEFDLDFDGLPDVDLDLEDDEDEDETDGEEDGETDEDGEETDGDDSETDEDGEETDGDESETDEDGEETDGDESETDEDGEETDGDESETDGDGEETDGDDSETDGDGEETDGDDSETGEDGGETDGDDSETGEDGGDSDGNDSGTDGDSGETSGNDSGTGGNDSGTGGDSGDSSGNDSGTSGDGGETSGNDSGTGDNGGETGGNDSGTSLPTEQEGGDSGSYGGAGGNSYENPPAEETPVDEVAYNGEMPSNRFASTELIHIPNMMIPLANAPWTESGPISQMQNTETWTLHLLNYPLHLGQEVEATQALQGFFSTETIEPVRDLETWWPVFPESESEPIPTPAPTLPPIPTPPPSPPPIPPLPTPPPTPQPTPAPPPPPTPTPAPPITPIQPPPPTHETDGETPIQPPRPPTNNNNNNNNNATPTPTPTTTPNINNNATPTPTPTPPINRSGLVRTPTGGLEYTLVPDGYVPILNPETGDIEFVPPDEVPDYYEPVLDPETGEPMLDSEGNPVYAPPTGENGTAPQGGGQGTGGTDGNNGTNENNGIGGGSTGVFDEDGNEIPLEDLQNLPPNTPIFDEDGNPLDLDDILEELQNLPTPPIPPTEPPPTDGTGTPPTDDTTGGTTDSTTNDTIDIDDDLLDWLFRNRNRIWFDEDGNQIDDIADLPADGRIFDEDGNEIYDLTDLPPVNRIFDEDGNEINTSDLQNLPPGTPIFDENGNELNLGNLLVDSGNQGNNGGTGARLPDGQGTVAHLPDGQGTGQNDTAPRTANNLIMAENLPDIALPDNGFVLDSATVREILQNGYFRDDTGIPWTLDEDGNIVLARDRLPSHLLVLENAAGTGFMVYSTSPAHLALAQLFGYHRAIYDADGRLIAVNIGTYTTDEFGRIVYLPALEIPLSAFIPLWYAESGLPLWLLFLAPIAAAAGGITWFILWLKRRKLIVEFVLDPHEKSYYQYYKRREKLEQPAISRDNYILEGWYILDTEAENDPTKEAKERERWNFSDKLTKDVVLHANWKNLHDGSESLDERYFDLGLGEFGGVVV